MDVHELLTNNIFVNNLGNSDIFDIVKGLNDNEQQQILYNEEFIRKSKLNENQLQEIISSISNPIREKILLDKILIKSIYNLTDCQIVELAKTICNEDVKNKIIEIYKLEKIFRVDIITTCSYNSKLQMLLKEKNLNRYDKIKILDSFKVEELIEFFNKYKSFFIENNIHPYEIVNVLDIKSQKFFVRKLEDINLTLNEKREILVILKEDVKKSIDTKILPKEYQTAINMKTKEFSNEIILNLEGDLEDYRGLDEIIRIYPESLEDVQKEKIMQLCDICPDSQVIDIAKKGRFISTGKEYKEAEEWIDSVISSLKPEYSDAQKLAIIDNAIGKKISYSPDFDTEVYDENDSRALWKIICTGYGVCNGIAKVEQYMLKKVGIESEIVIGKKHAFLKIKNIELPLANGETVKGNTIVDPTWNLVSYRFGGEPKNFCKSYEEIRKNDIDTQKKDHFCHKNDKELQDATLNLDEKSLRKLFSSVGLADKKGIFPIYDIFTKSELLNVLYENKPEQNVKEQLMLLSKVCPEFATCQNSSMRIISDRLLDAKYIRFKKCIVKRVYERKDKQKRPVLYVYIDLGELGKKFYYADKVDRKFIELSQENFIQRFECYKKDLKKQKGLRPWETENIEKENINLETSSGTMVEKKGEEK